LVAALVGPEITGHHEEEWHRETLGLVEKSTRVEVIAALARPEALEGVQRHHSEDANYAENIDSLNSFHLVLSHLFQQLSNIANFWQRIMHFEPNQRQRQASFVREKKLAEASFSKLSKKNFQKETHSHSNING